MRFSQLLAGLCLAVGLNGQTLGADGEPTFDKVSFYFAAHQDDWQLFMNPSAFHDVAGPKTKAVFVHMTAGDAGSGIGTRGRKHPFYLARENGAEAAIRFMADADGEPVNKTASYQRFNSHPVYRVSYRNTVSYFLRLPDGNPQGTGYFDTSYQSLRRLAGDDIDTLWAVDGSAAYRGWTDLAATVRAIVDFERDKTPDVRLNVAETDALINPGDHSDHLMTAKAALDSVANLACVRRAYYVNYASARLPENLNMQQRDLESAVFAVTAAGVRALDHVANWHWYDRSYVGRNYFRVEEGRGRCGEAAPILSAVKRRK
jgi:hypothetical protein